MTELIARGYILCRLSCFGQSCIVCILSSVKWLWFLNAVWNDSENFCFWLLVDWNIMYSEV